jgi:L-asparagine transporter-like permease
MLALIYAYLVAPRGFRRILRWLALCLVIVVLAMVIILFWRVLTTLPGHHRWLFHSLSHQSLTPDFTRYDVNQPHRLTKEGL